MMVSLWINVAVIAVPSVAFLVGDAIAGLVPGIVAAGIAGAAAVMFRLVRRERLRSVLVGVILVAACATAAAVTGQARGFFLVPTLIPFAVILVCLATIIARRPLTGILLNRVSGGPPRWWTRPAFARIHNVATSAAILINVVNAALQVTLYAQNDTVVLTIAHAATGPVFACLVAVTIVAVRRAIAADRTGAEVSR